MALPLPSEAVELQKHAALIDRETHLAHRGVELAADAFASRFADLCMAAIAIALQAVLTGDAQATAPKVEGA